MPTMGNSILLPGPEHPGIAARMLWSLKFIQNLSGGTKNRAGLINLLCPYCPNHNTLKFLAELNNAHTISFVLALFLLLIHWCDCSWQSRSPASLCLVIQYREITEQAPFRCSANCCHSVPGPGQCVSLDCWTVWQWWLQVWKNKHQTHNSTNILREPDGQEGFQNTTGLGQYGY